MINRRPLAVFYSRGRYGKSPTARHSPCTPRCRRPSRWVGHRPRPVASARLIGGPRERTLAPLNIEPDAGTVRVLLGKRGKTRTVGIAKAACGAGCPVATEGEQRQAPECADFLRFCTPKALGADPRLATLWPAGWTDLPTSGTIAFESTLGPASHGHRWHPRRRVRSGERHSDNTDRQHVPRWLLVLVALNIR